MTPDIPAINHEKHESHEKGKTLREIAEIRREKTRLDLERHDKTSSWWNELSTMMNDWLGSNLDDIQSKCAHDWEHGLGAGRCCVVCGKVEV